MSRFQSALIVTVDAEGDYYYNEADLVRHLTMWIEGALEDRDDIRHVAITVQGGEQA
ncbi:hypothetical protein [Streptomyces atriruber]|uniref:hypothetical protein n=1 Tax=Streptomyces atriruber TaxID=545121 RepID=UPI000A6ED410|nr:hypothetical protein [Streptomyces atriruber]